MSTPQLAPTHGLHGRDNNPQAYPTDKPEERRCETCNARVTQTPSMGEVGHKYGCPERPDRLPAGSGSSSSYYQEDDE